MTTFSNLPVTIIGASRGLGRTIAETFHRQGAQVLVTARVEAGLDAVARELPGTRTLACDAADAGTPAKVFAVQAPRLLILCGGAIPPCRPLPDMDWEAFSINWNIDVQMSFVFLQAVLKHALPAGTTVVTIASGAAINGSPVSGGYAGAKRMQILMSGYAQKEADRAGLELRFLAVSPGRIMPQADVGKAGVAGYAAYNGITEAAFVESMGPPLTLQTVADAVADLAGDGASSGHFLVSPDGVSALN